jgi:hypothetical protein
MAACFRKGVQVISFSSFAPAAASSAGLCSFRRTHWLSHCWGSYFVDGSISCYALLGAARFLNERADRLIVRFRLGSCIVSWLLRFLAYSDIVTLLAAASHAIH